MFETNAYDVANTQQLPLIPVSAHELASGQDIEAWRAEVAEANQAKRDNQYRIVIGNPPWRNPSPACRNKRIHAYLKGTIMPWAWEYRGEKLSGIKGCNHGVREDYAFFIGLALGLLKEQGMLVYVTNESWLTAPTYTLVRKYILDNYRLHSVVRLGPYFETVKERAAILILEKLPEKVFGRDQKIRFIDWSDLSNEGWTREWVDKQLNAIIKGKLSRRAWTEVVAVGQNCSIRPASVCSYSNDLPGCLYIDQLFRKINSGAQAGCTPLFMHPDREVVDHRVKLLLKRELQQLSEELAPSVRGGQEKALELVRRASEAARKYRVAYSRDAIRTVYAHFSGEKRKRGYCYFDARLWLRPRTDRVPPNEWTIWDAKPKLIFRDMYDPGDKRIVAAVDTTGAIIDNHVFNGGVYVASMLKDNGDLNLTEAGSALRRKFSSDAFFLYYLASVFNSPQVQDWGLGNPLERVRIPTDVTPRIAQRIAEFEAEKRPPWGRSQRRGEGEDREFQARLTDLFENLFRRLKSAA